MMMMMMMMMMTTLTDRHHDDADDGDHDTLPLMFVKMIFCAATGKRWPSHMLVISAVV